VDFLEALGCPRYKVSSFDIGNVPLIERIAKTGKPMIVSCGMATDDEIRELLVDSDLTLLHCVSEYPADPESMNIDYGLDRLRHRHAKIGLSDHSMTNTAAICATALGATMIEKHICLARADGGPDSGFSLEPKEFKEMVQAVREAEAACSLPKELRKASYEHLKPSIWITKDVEVGEPVTLENVAVRRPGLGLQPRELGRVLGRAFSQASKGAKPLTDACMQ
jgi:N-acetylneuraminate synthase